MNGEWRWTGAVTRLSINSALSASASQSSDLEANVPIEFDLLDYIVFSVELIFGDVQCFGALMFRLVYTST